MKQPSKKQIQYLRIALGMTGKMAINDYCAEFILITQSEMRRLKSDFSLRDAVAIDDFLTNKYSNKDNNA